MLPGTKSPLHPTWIRGTQVGKARKNHAQQDSHETPLFKPDCPNLTGVLPEVSWLRLLQLTKGQGQKGPEMHKLHRGHLERGEEDEWPEMGGFGG